MNKIKINIKGDEYIVDLALTEDEQYKGLSGKEKLEDNEGMLFIFKEEREPYFVMRDMKFPIDFIFIDKDNKIIDVQTGEVGSKEHYQVEEPVKAILEVNKGKASTYTKGDEILIDKKEIGGKVEKTEDKIEVKAQGCKITANKIGNIITFTKDCKIKTAENGFKIENPDMTYFDNPKVIEELKNDYEQTDKSISLIDYISDIKSNINTYKNYNKFLAYNFNRIFKNGGDLTYDKSSAVNIGDVKHKIKIKDVDLKKGHLHLLDDDGNLIYNLKGRERSYYIPHTEELFKKVLEDDDEGLADFILEILDLHDNQKAQYVAK